MKNNIFLVLWFIGFVSLACQPSPTPTPMKYNFDELDAFLARPDVIQAFQGKAVVWVKKEGETIYQRNVGGMPTEEVILVASATKWVAAAVLLSLAQDQSIDLDKNIGYYLPVFDNFGKGAPTVRQCFQIQSGFEECLGLETTCIFRDNTRTLAQVVERIAAETPLVFEPGSTMNYGGVGMQIAGRVAEVAGGSSWEQLFQQRIAQPCRMAGATFGRSSNPGIGGNLRCSATDYMNFLEMVRNQGLSGTQRVLSTEMVETFFRPQTPLPIAFSPLPPNPPLHPYNARNVYYGFGTWQDVVNPNTNIVEQISSPGAFGTYPYIDRVRGLSVVIFTQSDLAAVLANELTIIDLIRKAIDQGSAG